MRLFLIMITSRAPLQDIVNKNILFSNCPHKTGDRFNCLPISRISAYYKECFWIVFLRYDAETIKHLLILI